MTPRPRASSGTSLSGNISILRFSPNMATKSPDAARQTAASIPAGTFITRLPDRVMATAVSSSVRKPCPELAASSSLRPGWCTIAATISASGGKSMKSRIGSPSPRPPGSLAQSRVKNRPSVANNINRSVVSAGSQNLRRSPSRYLTLSFSS